MTDVDLYLVREFFELNFFRVMTHWQQGSDANRSERGLQLFVENANPAPERELGVVLFADDLPNIARAVVEVRPWHTDRFYSSVLESNPVITQFAQEEALGAARDFFGGASFKTILVVSELPVTPEQRARTVNCIEETKVDHVLEFPTILRSILSRVSINGGYAASHALQTIQLLKRYRLVSNQQLEFGFSSLSPTPSSLTEKD